MQRALVIGGSGFVGKRLAEMLGPRGMATYFQREVPGGVPFDAGNERLADLLPALPSDLSHVFVPYGIVDPERCARDPVGTAAINVVSVIAVLKDALDAGLTPIYFSTDYVFDGRRGRRREEDHPIPCTAYGAQKLAVEAWLGTLGGPSVIARPSKIVGGDPNTHSVIGQWVTDIRAGKKQLLAEDQVLSPTWIDDVCGALIKLADKGASGLYHVANPEAFSRLALFRLLLDKARERNPAIAIEITPARLHDLPFFSEKRPLDTSLSVDKFQTDIGWDFKPMETLCAEVATQAPP